MAKDDIFKIDKVAELNIHKVLIFLACDAVETKAKIAIMNRPPNAQVTQL